MEQSGISLDVVMPIPSKTIGRGHPWPVAARAFIYEGVESAVNIGRMVGRAAQTVRHIRREDGWRDFRAQTATREVAARHGISLPFMLAAGSLDGQLTIEADERAERAAGIRAELDACMALMAVTTDKAGARYSRLVACVAALQLQLDGLLGLDVARKVATASAIHRSKHAARPKPIAAYPPHLRRDARLAQMQPDQVEPDVTTLLPG